MRVPSVPALLPLAALLLSGCTVGRVHQQRPAAAPIPELSWVFDCLRENRLALVSAHRGQPDPDAAENSLESFTRSLDKGPILIEIDIARTADGELMLLHDDTLDRTTTGRGPIGRHSYRELRQLYLKDGKGEQLSERIPTLEEALIWARRKGAVLQLDLKKGVGIDEVVRLVRATRTERQVILIAYTSADAQAAMRAAPEMMVSASDRNPANVQRLLDSRNPRLLGFTGTTEPSPELIARMDAAGIEAITGTLGRSGQRLDDRYMADGDGSEYAELAARGVALIATDRPADAWKALKKADRDGSMCLTGRSNGDSKR
jgi:glycerophosphoryl diester phosphodiesterase